MTASIIVCYNEGDKKIGAGILYENNNKKYCGCMQSVDHISISCPERKTKSYIRGDKRADTENGEKNELQTESQCGGIGQGENKNHWSYHYGYRQYVFVRDIQSNRDGVPKIRLYASPGQHR